jgi:hypothetical protein
MLSIVIVCVFIRNGLALASFAQQGLAKVRVLLQALRTRSVQEMASVGCPDEMETAS